MNVILSLSFRRNERNVEGRYDTQAALRDLFPSLGKAQDDILRKLKKRIIKKPQLFSELGLHVIEFLFDTVHLFLKNFI